MTPETARDEIFNMLQTAWEDETTGAAAAVDSDDEDLVIPMYWQGIAVEPPSLATPYGRASLQHVSGHQATLSGSNGAQRYERRGFLMVQCLAPIADGNAPAIAYRLASVVTMGFEGKASPGGAWFRNCRPIEVGASGGWFTVNAIADFTYDEVH